MTTHPFRRMTATVLAAASLFPIVWADHAVAGETPPTDQIVSLCREAKADFRPLTQQDLTGRKAELIEAVSRLQQRLDADGQNGAAWREYLQLDRLEAQIARGTTPDVAVLDEVGALYAAEHEGLDLVWFIDVREAIDRYHAMVRSVENTAMQANYEQLVDFLATRLEIYAAQPTIDEAAIIGQVIRQLEDARQAPALVRAIRHRFQQPNLSLSVSAELIGAGIGRPVDEVAPVREVILKTDVFGTGHTVGQVTPELVDDPSRALIETVLRADVSTQSIGYNGPVRIYSTGATELVARKRLSIDATGLTALPAVADATTHSTINAIRAKNCNQLIERIAWKRAGKQKCEADCIASRLAELRVRQRVDEETGDLLAQANRDYSEKFRRPLVERKLFPQSLEFSTTTDSLNVVSLQADAGQLAAPTPAPMPEVDHDLAVCVHESMIVNMATSALSGRTLNQETLEKTIIQIAGKLPEQLEADEDQQDWGITFPRTQPPISVRFADNRLKVTIRGQRFFQGGEAYPGMEISVEYAIERTEQGYRAVRQGEMEIVPLRVAGAASRQLSSREVVIRTLLQRRFDKIFKEELAGEGFVLPEQLRGAGKLSPVALECQEGWLTAAWECEPVE